MKMKSQQITATIIILINLQIKGYAQESTKSTCGRRLIHHKASITNGFPSNEGDWPWHAAIFHLSSVDFKYKCGGSVLNSNSILTAAHCVFEYNRQIVPERLIVELGVHDLRVPGTNTQHFKAYKVIPHPHFNTSSLSNDIAIIRLSTEASLNNYVQPICLWDPNKVELSEIVGRMGTVIGWGITETDELSYILRNAKVPVVSVLTCLRSNSDVFGSYLSDKNFCAGFRNGTNVCSGDSGGSLTFEENGAYQIRGIVSLTVSREDNRELCNSKEFAIFTDVAKYLSWIEEVVPQLKSESDIDDRAATPNENGSRVVETEVAHIYDGSCLIPANLSDTIKVYFEASDTTEVSKGFYVDNYGSVIYKCATGYTLDGNQTNVCVYGRWIQEHAVCQGNCSSITDEITITASCEISGNPISCMQPIPFRTTAKINCAIGYRKPNGAVDDVHECDRNGEWNNPSFSCEPICGEEAIEITNIKGHVSGSIPWHVGIYSNAFTSRFVCGGTIINAKLVISSAGCFWDVIENRINKPENYKIAAGKYYSDLNAIEAIEPQIIDVRQIVYPPEFNSFKGYYASDIALLHLVTHIRFNSYIKPICLETDLNFNERKVPPGLVGQVVGWGLETSSWKLSPVLKFIEVPAIAYKDCLKELDPDSYPFITLDKFCVGNSTGQSSICHGDGGGGFVYWKMVDAKKLFFLRGIVSVFVGKKGSCGNSNFLFINIQLYIDFIKYYVKTLV